MTPGRVCRNCANYAGLTKECRAKSPVVFLVTGPNGQPVNVGAFPPVTPDHWCGEWKAELLA